MGPSLFLILNLLLSFYCFGKSFYVFYSFEFYLLAFKLPILVPPPIKTFFCLFVCILSPVAFRFYLYCCCFPLFWLKEKEIMECNFWFQLFFSQYFLLIFYCSFSIHLSITKFCSLTSSSFWSILWQYSQIL